MILDFEDGELREYKFSVGKKKKTVKIKRKDNRLWFSFGFSGAIKDAIKERMSRYRWHGFEDPPIKKWSVEYNQRNLFQIAYLAGMNPYAHFDKPLIEYEQFGEPNDLGCHQYRFGEFETPHLFAHQAEMLAHVLTRRYSILGATMGTGKTLVAILALQILGFQNILWVGTKSSIASTELEMRKWKFGVEPHYINYRSLPKLYNEWIDGVPIYPAIIFDESSRIKNGTTKQGTAAQLLADAVREDHGWNGLVVEMTGTPAPKMPTDWHAQTEVAYPGFLREGHVSILKGSLAVIHERKSVTGGVYPHLVTWLDDEKKCIECGEFADSDYHTDPLYDDHHPYQPAKVNKVHELHSRMRGLVMIKLKKDCLDLPDKHYRTITIKPTRKVISAMNMIKRTSTSAIKALTALRQLSDGFKYGEKEVGRETCPTCGGVKTVEEPVYNGPEKTEEFIRSLEGEATVPCNYWDEYPLDPVKYPQYFEQQRVACPLCDGTGEIIKYERETNTINCPKQRVLREVMEEHFDIGRLVVFGGYTGSVDIITETVKKSEDWNYIRMDGRGWHSDIEGTPLELLEHFQSGKGRCVFIGQPSAAGMGLTLTASPTILYYSNDFNGESRMQSEDRIHRPGMDYNLGATIIDIVHLPSDQYIIDNLKKKVKLQSLTMGDLDFDAER